MFERELLLISHFHISIMSEEYHSHRSLIPQKIKHSNTNLIMMKNCASRLEHRYKKTTSLNLDMQFDYLRLTEQKREILHIPRTGLRFAQIKDDSYLFQGYKIDLNVMIDSDVRLLYVNRFVQDLVRYSTTGPIMCAADEMKQAPVVQSVIEIAKETSEKVKQTAVKAARRQLETEVPLLPRLELHLGKSQ